MRSVKTSSLLTALYSRERAHRELARRCKKKRLAVRFFISRKLTRTCIPWWVKKKMYIYVYTFDFLFFDEWIERRLNRRGNIYHAIYILPPQHTVCKLPSFFTLIDDSPAVYCAKIFFSPPSLYITHKVKIWKKALSKFAAPRQRKNLSSIKFRPRVGA